MNSKKLSFGARFGLWFLSFLLGFALFVAALSTSLIADARVLTNADTLEKLIRQVVSFSVSNGDLAAAPHNAYTLQPLSYNAALPIDDASPVADSSGDNLGQAILDSLYAALEEDMGTSLPISKEEMGELIEQSTVKDYLTEKTAGMVSDFIRGDVTTTIEPEDIRQLLDENEELISSVLGQPLPEEYTEKVVEWIAESEVINDLNTNGIQELIPIPSEEPAPSQGLANTLYYMNDVMEIVRSVISLPAFFGCLAVCLVLIALIILCNWGRWGIGLRRCGYPLLFASLPLIPCLITYADAPFNDSTFQLIWSLMSSFTPVYALILGIGVAFVISGIIVAHLQGRTPSVAVVHSAVVTAEPIVQSTPVQNAPIAVENVAAAEETPATVEDTVSVEEVPAAVEDTAAVEEVPAADSEE